MPTPTEPFDVVVPAPAPPPLTPGETGLLIIDLQYLDAHPDLGLGRTAREKGQESELRYRFDRIAEILPAVDRLAAACRVAGIQVIYLRIATARADGRDGSPSLRGLWCAEGSREAEVLDEIKPQPGDIVMSKSSISAFSSTALDAVLHNLGIRTLIAAGIVTNGCVELTMRDAADRGYFGVIVDDCCGANSEALHRDALGRMDRGLLRVAQSDDVIRELLGGKADEPRVLAAAGKRG